MAAAEDCVWESGEALLLLGMKGTNGWKEERSEGFYRVDTKGACPTAESGVHSFAWPPAYQIIQIILASIKVNNREPP